MRTALLILLTGTAIAAAPPSFYARRDYGNGGGCGGQWTLAIGDINGDGNPDIFCGGGQFLIGDGRGKFVLSGTNSQIAGCGMVLTDLDNDGVVDIFSLGSIDTYCFKVVLGTGGGHLAPPVLYPVPDVNLGYDALGDFNGDGKLDGVSAGNLGIWLITGNGDGTFNTPTLAVSYSGFYGPIKTVDLNGDGKLDLITGVPAGFAVLLGNGDGTFQAPVTYTNPYKDCSVSIGDINSDGHTDVLCTSVLNNEVVTIFLGKPGGTFQAPYEFSLPHGGDVEVGDLNGDGVPDLISDSVYVAYGLGQGAFSTPVYFPNSGGAHQVVLGHLRSKNLLDVVTNSTFSGDSVLLNNGKGGLIEGISVPFPSGGGCVAQADFNGDGIPDIGMVQNNSSFTVVLGTGALKDPFTAGPSFPFPFADPDPYYGACITNAGDMNGDGIPDVIVTIPTDSSASNIDLLPLIGTGGGNFKAARPIKAGNNVSLYLVDVNGDGYADYINALTNQVAYGNGDGTFQAPVMFINADTGPIGYITWADFNGDGKLDFLVGGVFNTYTMLSQPGGGFAIVPLPAANFGASGASTGDLNGDGAPDIVFGSPIDEMAVCLNDGHGNFSSAPIYLRPYGLTSASPPLVMDVNGDGLNDIVVGDEASTAIFTNLGGARFDQPEYFGEVNTGGLYIGNWHGQPASAGKPDMFQFYSTGGGVFMPNTTE